MNHFKKAKVLQSFQILALDESGYVADDEDNCHLGVPQHKDDIVDVWKTREDGFHFVYCNTLNIGYWVRPCAIEIIEVSLRDFFGEINFHSKAQIYKGEGTVINVGNGENAFTGDQQGQFFKPKGKPWQLNKDHTLSDRVIIHLKSRTEFK
jgi:hypothetical protein